MNFSSFAVASLERDPGLRLARWQLAALAPGYTNGQAFGPKTIATGLEGIASVKDGLGRSSYKNSRLFGPSVASQLVLGNTRFQF